MTPSAGLLLGKWCCDPIEPAGISALQPCHGREARRAAVGFSSRQRLH
jgi:hypothetical protein